MITINRRIVSSLVPGSVEKIWFRTTSVKLFNYFTLFRINEQLGDPREKDPCSRLQNLNREMLKSDPLTRAYDAGYQAALSRERSTPEEIKDLTSPALPPIPSPK